MADNSTVPQLTAELRKTFESVYFGNLSAPKRRAAVTKALAALEPLTRKEVVALVKKVEAGKISTENARENLAAFIVTGKALSGMSQTPTKAQMKKAFALVKNTMAEDGGKIGATLRMVAEQASVANKEEAEPFVDSITDAAETAKEPGAETPATETEEETGSETNPGEENPMEPDFVTLMAELNEHFAFDESKLPERLHYDTQDGKRVLSEGQLAFLHGAVKALEKLGHSVKGAGNGNLLPAAIGMLLVDGHTDPDAQAFFGYVMDAVSELNSAADPSHGEVGNKLFETGFSQKREVFEAAMDVILDDDGGEGGVFYDALASVGREMVDIHDSVKPADRGFATAVRARYSNQTLKLGGGSGGGSGVAFLDLPPLSDPSGSDSDIVKENIQAIASIYVVYQCEQMMLFSVTDRIVELFMAGLLPMQGDSTARHLDNYYWNKDDRVSATGRSAQFTRALGAPGGDIGGDVSPNGEFNNLLMRAVSSVSEYERQNSVGNLLDSSGRRASPTSGEYVRKAFRDLGANCTLYGFAGVQFAAERMGTQLKSAMQILQLPRVREIYGVTTMWQVIERVAQSEFGTTVNVVKHRTMAEEIRKLLEIVAENGGAWSSTTGKQLFHPMNGLGHQPASDLSSDDSSKLFRAAQYFLAVNGLHGDQVYEYSQPVDTPALPSIPGMGAWSGGGAQQQQPMQAPAMPVDPIGGLHNMASGGRAPTGADIRSAISLP